ncbi:MAG TPA: bifunctional phosphoribosylaminoimidazolecarboxamide formyltransferase/IMP cyclohydrolase PurH [Acidimicrobiales bacterium]|nr:bifunctional phosphoribosylaminoimidazolecarboxamide formyltransferase/IMP cyclohydrolase PurH [Acidimicrobiales bacterium]
MRVLLSVYDKTGLEDFARQLVELGHDLIASGGTAGALQAAGIPHRTVESVTEAPEMLGGRVKTLHPRLHGGILADLTKDDHRVDLQRQGIEPIGMVVCNLYPFRSNPSIELIDVGGPTMVRAAAKNWAHVASVVHPADYSEVLAELRQHGELSEALRRRLAASAFAHTAAYDAAIANWFAEEQAGDDLPQSVNVALEKAQPLRYGENPHQRGARYRAAGEKSWWDDVVQHGGMELSYLNLYDADAAWRLAHQLADLGPAAAVVVKHANPCGAAVAEDPLAAYDAAIANWFASEEAAGADQSQLPTTIDIALERAQTLRYGENPHQRGARYRVVGEKSWWDDVEQHGGMELSYLNLYDADAAWRLAHQLADLGPAAAVVVKHANPCGAAVADDPLTAYDRAFECDPMSAFGGIVALTAPVTEAVAQEMVGNAKADVLIAPSYDDAALELFATKRKNMRVLSAPAPGRDRWHLRQISGGWLVQDPYVFASTREDWRVVTKAQPTGDNWRDIELAWRVCAWVKSNAIVLAANGMAVGIGGGQQNRVTPGEIASARAAGRAKGGAAASDAFFPFRDGLDACAAAGVAAVIQPGGSVNDDKVIEAADEHGLVMVFTGERQFQH